MLKSLAVKDFAIIEAAELVFDGGLTALTGETGAGKSLLVDALLLLSGARSDASFVRHGTERAELSAEFSLKAGAALRDKLAELELDDGDQCRLRRVIRRDGSSRSFINDTAVGLATLRELAAELIEIHGQHEAQALLDPQHQLVLLDAYGGHEPLLAEVASAARGWRALSEQRHALAGKAGADPAALEFMKFQLDELQRNALSPPALIELEAEHRRLAHAGELQGDLAQALETVDGEASTCVRRQIAGLRNTLAKSADIDPRLAPAIALLDSMAAELDELTDVLQRQQDSGDLDPARLDEVDAHLSRLHELGRKHRLPVAQLAERRDALAAEIEIATSAGDRLEALDREIAAQRDIYRRHALALSKARAGSAPRLGAAVSALMAELGMLGGRLLVQLNSDADAEPGLRGNEQVEFLVSANPGQPERPLRKVASGGELARISLAIEVAALGKDEVPTMVFDEVDAGIGGAVAEVVGRKLRELGAERQVLCVTHLPQVAAQAHQHVAVHKRSSGQRTETGFSLLSAPQRTEELARMLGGIEITRETRAHAAAMLKRAG